MNKQPLHKEKMNWRETIYLTELYDIVDFSNFEPITQVQAVPFLDKSTIVLFEHIDGYFSIPGGSIEKGESINEALHRELDEEASIEVIDYGPIGYIKATQKEKPENIFYHLRFWAKVKLKKETPDPDGKALKRVIVPVEKGASKLGWGKRGEIIIKLALRGYLSKYHN